jgi:4'-phosphopantetheinyl transferase
LQAIEIDFWHRSLEINPVRYQQDWDLLDDEEKTRAAKFTNALLKQRYVAAHGFLRTILAHYLQLSPASLHIQKTAQGKPYLADYSELAFNLSHTGNDIAVAVAKNCQLGVDIEQCKQRANLTDLVNRCFAEPEAAYWYQLPEDKQQQAFYQFWTRKEAFVKATGLGITLGLHDCVINPHQPHIFLSVPTQCGAADVWHCRDIALGQNLCAALVANKAIVSVNMRGIGMTDKDLIGF